MINRVVAQIALVVTSVVLSVLVMEHGWGLEPRSWGWIIGVGFFGQMIVTAFAAAAAIERRK